MKPLRFRSLPGGWIPKPTFSRAAAVAVAVVISLAGASAQAGDHVSSTAFLTQEDCKRDLNSGSTAIFRDDGRTLKNEFDPARNCAGNSGDEILSRNAAAADAAEISRTRGKFTRRSDFRRMGICKSAYNGVKDVYEHFADLRGEYCKKLNAALEEATSCGISSKDCKPKWEAFQKINKTYGDTIGADATAALAYLEALSKAANKARDEYQEDLTKLDEALRRKPSTAIMALPGAVSAPAPQTLPGDALSDNPDVKAANGNRSTQSADPAHALELYHHLLRGPDNRLMAFALTDTAPVPTGLVKEEEAAANSVISFGKSLTGSLKSYRDNAYSVSSVTNDMIARIDQNASASPSGITGRVNTGLGVASAAAPLAQTFLKNPSNELAGAAREISGASHDMAPVAGLAAAAGLGALAARSFDGSSRSAAGPAVPAEAPAVAPSGAPKQGDTATLGEAPAVAPHATVPGTTTANNVKNDGPAKAEAEGGGGAGAGLGLAEGSSRSPAGKRSSAPAPTPASSGSPIDAGGAGTPDAMGTFGQNLTPQPAPKAAAPSPGSEVANLLGQMKNLFNFDESNPMGGGGPGAPVPGGSAPSPDAYAQAPGAAPDAPAGLGATEPTEEAAASASPGNAGTEEVHASPFGKTETSLFARVRARHHRCMERGLVLYGLKERVE